MINISKPLLSIVLPTYNRCEILNLTLKNIISEVEKLEGLVEIVIGDNASSDKTATVLETHRNNYSRMIRHESNIGAWSNIAALAKMARGDWLLIIGDDDYLVPGALKKIVLKLQQSRNSDMICINYGWIDANILKSSLENKVDIKSSNNRMWMIPNDMVLENGSDIFGIPSSFSAGAFSALFGFIFRRRKFLEFSISINPRAASNGFSESEFVLEEAFPHSIIAIQIMHSSQIEIFSDISIMQGVGQWEWKRFLYRTVIVGHVLLFLRFKSIIPEAAWTSLASYSGIRLARMLNDPNLNFGISEIQKIAFPFLFKYSIFEKNFISECIRIGIEREGKALIRKWINESII